MHPLTVFSCLTGLASMAYGSCNHDNCYRAIERYQSSTSTAFCSQYLMTPTQAVPNGIATCGPTRASSACSCLTATAPSTPTTSTFNPSTCARQSIAACPTPYDPCCAYICAEAQVPFQVCSPKNETLLAQCSQCPSTGLGGTAPTTTLSTPKITSTPSPTTLSASTCTGRLLSTAACPTPYDPCCAWNCQEAQVPYNVCAQSDQSGEFEVCTKCPSPTARIDDNEGTQG